MIKFESPANKPRMLDNFIHLGYEYFILFNVNGKPSWTMRHRVDLKDWQRTRGSASVHSVWESMNDSEAKSKIADWV